jgi:hypothetical protein
LWVFLLQRRGFFFAVKIFRTSVFFVNSSLAMVPFSNFVEKLFAQVYAEANLFFV